MNAERYERIVSVVFGKPWAILPETLRTIAHLVALRVSGQKFTEEEIRERLAPARERAAARPGSADYGVVAIIPIRGVISQKINMMSQISGGTSVEKLTASFRSALADPTIKAIMFDVDSPGGGVEGVPELAAEILKSRGKKKTVAVANAMCASAAYWIASAAEEFVVIPSGQVGSIGVFVAHEDVSKAMEAEGVKVSLISAGKHKTDGNPYEPLSEEARADLQSKVDGFYQMFVKDVAAGRGVKPSDVRNGYGQGRMLLAGEAVREGLADRIATLEETVASLGGVNSSSRRISASADLEDGDPDLDECPCICDSCLAGNCEACTAAECTALPCKAEGCPMQTEPKAAAASYQPKPIALLRRELELHRGAR